MLTRVVVLGLAEGSALICRPAGSVRLPSFTTELDPDDESPIAALRAELTQQLGIDGAILELYRPSQSTEQGPAETLLVVEPTAAARSGHHAHEWRPVDELDMSAIPATLRGRSAQWLGEASGRAAVPALRAAWSRPGWHARAMGWLDEALAKAGRTRTGEVEQMRLWGISMLSRAATDRGPVWMKGAYPPFGAEPRITRLLADRAPGAVPSVLETNDEEGWTLLDDFGGKVVSENRGGDVGTAAIALLASIQHGFAEDLGPLIDAGAAQRPIDRLPAALADAFTEEIEPKPWTQSVARRAELVELLLAWPRHWSTAISTPGTWPTSTVAR